MLPVIVATPTTSKLSKFVCPSTDKSPVTSKSASISTPEFKF